MNGGLVAFLVGVLGVIVAWLTGRASTKAKANAKVAQAKAETANLAKAAQIQSDVTPIVVRAATERGITQAEHEAIVHRIENARKTNDLDSIRNIAVELAQKALEKGASQR